MWRLQGASRLSRTTRYLLQGQRQFHITSRCFSQGAATEVKQPSGGGEGSSFMPIAIGLAAAGAAGFVIVPSPSLSKEVDYESIKKQIQEIIDDENYDDGSYGPLLIRLAWHASGTYDKVTGTGGSNSASMRFPPESEHGANAGLGVARALLEPIKKNNPGLSYADLWTLAGVVAVEEMGGPKIPWLPGRVDAEDATSCTPDGRLPDGDKGAKHIRDIFYRMGFNDQEIVALSGAHTLGRCHADRSGFVNPWTNAPTTFSNLYFQELLNTRWTKKKWDGPLQYEDPTGTLMMLATDLSLVWDRKFKPYVKLYAKDEEKFFEDFAAAFSKLLCLGVPKCDPTLQQSKD